MVGGGGGENGGRRQAEQGLNVILPFKSTDVYSPVHNWPFRESR